jgi:FRG domain
MNDIMPVTSFLNYVETVENEVRKSGYSLGSDNILLYRGQQSANWKLRPSIAVKWKSRRNEEKRFGDLERELFEDFQKRTFPFLQSIPESRLDWLTLAQHHQLPTRLLDWSANAFTALWFVVSKNATARATTGRSDDDSEFGAVWIFRTERHDWLEPELEESIDIFNPLSSSFTCRGVLPAASPRNSASSQSIPTRTGISNHWTITQTIKAK